MKRPAIGIGVLRPLALGALLGGLAAALLLPEGAEQQRIGQRPIEQETWPPREFYSHCGWHYLRVDESGWSTGGVGSFEDLGNRLGRPETPGQEITIPIFPTVYMPRMCDKLYYDAILESDIECGDKVLVIGTGSGADAWVASLKSKDLVYVVEINPMAVVNAGMTAHLANFRIKPIVGDVTTTDLPDDFREFDYVLWNMPFLKVERKAEDRSVRRRAVPGSIEERDFHDGDDGTILKDFLALLPSLLKKGGKAILLNVSAARDLITAPGVTTETYDDIMLFVIPNP